MCVALGVLPAGSRACAADYRDDDFILIDLDGSYSGWIDASATDAFADLRALIDEALRALEPRACAPAPGVFEATDVRARR